MTDPRPREFSQASNDRSPLVVEFLPHDPIDRSIGIGLIGCGGIAGDHLRAYREAGYRVVALCDLQLDAAKRRRDEFFPQADVFSDYRRLISHNEVQVVDIATHVQDRPPLVEASLLTGRHVLSQKPFVEDLDLGKRLADLADERGMLLAVNQNARWAPHFSYMREAVRTGIIGRVHSVRCGVHWDHGWVEGTPFESLRHLLLFDFAIHWFDFIHCVLPDREATSIYAAAARSPNQRIDEPLQASALIEYADAQASLVLDGHTQHDQRHETLIIGSHGTVRSFGPDSNNQTVELTTAEGAFRPRLKGRWFPDGFHGTMGELLCAIEQGRQPMHAARDNLNCLSLCFAAASSAMEGKPVTPGSVRQLPA